MKRCPKCKLTLSTDAFGASRAKKDGLQTHCKACRVELNAAYYQKTKFSLKETRRRSSEAINARNRLWVREYFESHPCVDCGTTDLRVLEFDHLGSKLCNVSQMMSHSLENLQAEVEKCEVVCANCHRIRTYDRSGNCWRLAPLA